MAATHDVFLSYSTRDKEVVHDLANRLRDRGLRVWLDAWEVQPGDPIFSCVEQGLEGSAVLVLCMSRHALGSDWAALESQTFRFRDPLNKERRFIPLRLDDEEPRGSLAQFLYVDWRARSDGELERLVRACRAGSPEEEPAAITASPPPGRAISLGHTDEVNAVAYHPDGTHAISASDDHTVRVWNLHSGTCEQILEGHTGWVWGVAYHPGGTHAVSAGDDQTVRVWNLHSGTCEQILEGHTGRVLGVAYHPDATHAITAGADQTVRVWNLHSGTCEQILKGHTGTVLGVAYHPDATHAVSAGADQTVRVWNLHSGTCEQILKGHTDRVLSVAYHPDATHAISAGDDQTVRIWNLQSGACEQILNGHTGRVRGVAYHPDATHAISAGDQTVRVWNLQSGACEQILEGHTGRVWGVAYHHDATHAVSASDDQTVRIWNLHSGACEQILLEGHTDRVWGVAYHPDATHAVSASDDQTVRVWNLQTGACEQILEGHTGPVFRVAYHPYATHAVSASADRTVRVWNLQSGACEQILKGHTDDVSAVAYHPDGAHAISASADRTVRVWNLQTGACEQILEGHTGAVLGVAYHPDGTHAISAGDQTVRVWNLQSGACEQILRHTGRVNAVAYHPDGAHAISASADTTVRVWNLQTSVCEQILEGHTGAVLGVAYHPDGAHAISASADTTVRVWNLQTGACERILEGHTDRVLGVAYHPDGATILSAAENGVLRIWPAERTGRQVLPHADASVSYTNAKVVLVGESQAGKTGLAMRLAHDRWELTESTVGAWATHLRLAPPAALPGARDGAAEREIWLWDFGGQADQRLIHQLYMGDVALAVLVFDGQRDDAMVRLWDWNRALTSAGRGFPKLLAAGRTDVNPVRLNRAQLEQFCGTARFDAYVETSAKTEDDPGCRELRESIVATIDWGGIPHRSSPEVFRRLKEAILRLKDAGRMLTSVKELRDLLPARIGPFEPAQLDAVIGLLAGPGAVLPLGFGDYVLLAPELVNAYAQAVVRSLRDDPQERGAIAEDRVLQGDLRYPDGFERLPEGEEHIVLHAMHRLLVERSICQRVQDPQSKTVLVFPSYYRRERPDRPGRPQSFMTYDFGGYLDDIYASLVGRLHYTQPFHSAELWRGAADFTTIGGTQIGIRMTPRPDGSGELELHCEHGTPTSEQALFARYVGEHLRTSARDVTRLRTFICPDCATPVENRDAARRRQQEGRQDIACSYCDARIAIWDEIEREFASDGIRVEVEQLRDQAQEALDSESRERLLVGEVYAMVARAGQIARELTVSDHGIDMEIEFRDDDGRATGRKLYLQLESGDSHLRERKRDDVRVFRIRKERHADYWADQAFPVWLVVRDSSGAVEWMEISARLGAERDAGRWPARELAFEGERFDVMSIRRRRDLALGRHDARA